ncbi:hypothetical protein J6590_053615 [Homalodisca vitripennis]|nr:hypothetical protein J6590_053615 [Homalodisca vitripennis]
MVFLKIGNHSYPSHDNPPPPLLLHQLSGRRRYEISSTIRSEIRHALLPYNDHGSILIPP